MEFKKISNEMTLALAEPLPKEALKAHPTMQGLTAINQIYIIERLNKVFGIGSWQLRDELLSPIMENSKQGTKGVYKDYTSLVKVTLTIPEYNIHMECIAGSTNKDEGDSAKGGITDCITKIASWLGIGHEVYKGQHNRKTEPQKQTPQKVEQPKVDIQPKPDKPVSLETTINAWYAKYTSIKEEKMSERVSSVITDILKSDLDKSKSLLALSVLWESKKAKMIEKKLLPQYDLGIKLIKEAEAKLNV